MKRRYCDALPGKGHALQRLCLLKSGEIAEDLTKYLFDSEQTLLSWLWVSLSIKMAPLPFQEVILFSLFPARAMSSSKRLKITALPCHT